MPARPELLVQLDTAYRQNAWSKTRSRVLGLLSAAGLKAFSTGHQRNLGYLERLMKSDLQDYYGRIR